MSRAYVRLDPAFFERKAIDQAYPPGAVAALVGCICLGEAQPTRGTFRDERLLRALLGPVGKWVKYLLDQGDLVHRNDGRLYIDGWEEWQEGDWQVKERVARIRNRKRANSTPATVTSSVTDRPSGAGRGGGIAGRGAPNRDTDNCYDLFQRQTGSVPTAKERQWIDELVRDFTRPDVAQAIHQDEGGRGLLGRVSQRLRHKEGAA